MRDYGKVYTAFWSNEDMRSMSEDARMLALYLMTCPHGNMLGCFRLPNAYAAEDLKWESERVSKGFDELFEKGFSYRCERSFWVFIRKYLEWNQFENPNVGKAAGKLFDSLPMPDQIKALLVNALRQFSPVFPDTKLDAFETLSIPFSNPFETVSKTGAVAVVVTKPEPESKPESREPKQDKTQRASRLPAGWTPSEADIEYCKTQRPELDPARVAENFRDYWHAKSGKDATKLDWPATWRTWVRNERAPQDRRSAQRGTPDRRESRHSGFENLNYNEGISDDGRF